MKVPATSIKARDGHEASGKLAGNRALCLGLVRKYPGKTAVELHALHEAAGGTMSRTEVSRRLPELISLGLARKGPERKCEINKTSMAVWYPVVEESEPVNVKFKQPTLF